MKTRKLKAVGVAFASIWLCCAACSVEAQPTALSREKIVEVIRKERIIKNEAPLGADIEGNEVELVTVRSALAKDNDCKIDSMLMARALMQAFPGEVMRLKVQFGYTNRDDVDEVTVTAGEVKAYGSGAMSESELLASLDMETRQASDVVAEKNGDKVKAGPAKETRMLIVGYIEELREHGTDVKPFETRLKQIEDSIGTADSSTIKDQSLDLKRRLTDVEAMIRDAQSIQSEHPMQHKEPAQAPSIAKAGGAGAPRSAPRFNQALMRDVRQAITQQKTSGVNVYPFEQKVAEIQAMRMQKHFDDAEAALESLDGQLHVR